MGASAKTIAESVRAYMRVLCDRMNIEKYRRTHNPLKTIQHVKVSWWRHQMETFSALLAICAGNSPVTGEFPAQRPTTRNFHVFVDLRLNKLFSKQSWSRWFETPSHPLWRHCNVIQLTKTTWAHFVSVNTLCRTSNLESMWISSIVW